MFTSDFHRAVRNGGIGCTAVPRALGASSVFDRVQRGQHVRRGGDKAGVGLLLLPVSIAADLHDHRAHRALEPLFCMAATDNGREGVKAERVGHRFPRPRRSEEHTSELQSLMRISYAVFCLKKKNITTHTTN